MAISRATAERVPAEHVPALFADLRRIVPPGGSKGRTNRLRYSDALALAHDAGKLAPEFVDRDPHDLATTATLLVARRDD